jgi:hypothetical protein
LLATAPGLPLVLPFVEGSLLSPASSTSWLNTAVRANGAAVAVVDAVAVANPEVSLGAEHPDRLLQEAGEKRWAVGTELAGVDAPRRLLDDADTTTRPIASYAGIWVTARSGGALL